MNKEIALLLLESKDVYLTPEGEKALLEIVDVKEVVKQ